MQPKDPCAVNCELFGKRGSFFDTSIAPLWGEVYDSLILRARVARGSKVLDVGTGSGEVALRLSNIVGRDGSVTAIDAQPKMLQIAADKTRRRRIRNIQFDEMGMEKLRFPPDSFDSVLANYSLCCCMDYRAALAECLKVLKPGARLTYNHGGPSDPLATQVIFKIFEGYKTSSPSNNLRGFRESRDAQVEAFKKYRDPFTSLELMRSLGYEDAEATLTRHSLDYEHPGSFIEQWLLFDWAAEAEEISPRDLLRFKKEATEAIRPLSKGPRFIVERDVVYFTGLKRRIGS